MRTVLNGEPLWVCVYLRFVDFQGKRCPRKGDFRDWRSALGGGQWSKEGVMVWVRADFWEEFKQLHQAAGIPFEIVG
jgi:hypothetical protein